MNESGDLLSDARYVKALIESLPCGLLVIDEDGLVRAINNISGHFFGAARHVESGEGLGHILGCLRVVDEKNECGLT